MKNIDIVIHNGTGAVLECLSYKRPIIKYISENLDFDSLSNFWDGQITVSEDKLNNLSSYLKIKKDFPNYLFYEPFNESVWGKLIGINKNNIITKLES